MTGSGKPEREWLVREYQEGDEDRILELRGMVLRGSKDKRWWNWMYRDGPAGPALVVVAEAKHRIIGHMASTFVPLKVGGRTTLGAHGIDLMVHPDYRRQGIFKTLGMKLRGLTRAKEWSLTYGTPDDESYQGFVTRLNVLDIGELPFLFKIIDLSAILKNRYRIPVFIGKMLGYAWESITNGRRSPEDTEIKIDEVFSFDEQIDKFWEKASQLKSIMVIKDMKYLNWRYVAKPGKEYKILIAKKQEEIAGFIVLKLVKGAPSRGYIADLLTLPGEGTVAESLIARVIRYFKEEGAVSVSCWLFQNTIYYGILRKMGFLRRSGPRFCTRIVDPNIPREFAADPANWYYVAGDGDAI